MTWGRKNRSESLLIRGRSVTGEPLYMVNSSFLSKKTLEQLKGLETSILKEISANNNDIQKQQNHKLYEEETTRIKKLKEEHKHIEDRITEIRKIGLKRKQQEYETAGTLKKLFMEKIGIKLTEPEIAELHELELTLCNKFSFGYDKNIHEKYKDDTPQLLFALKHVQSFIAKKEKKDEKKNTERAIIAAHQGKSRHLASRVKTGLKAQINIDPQCPYCGDVIGDDPHCDHIYPVSKGGLSRPQNMVYICSSCNMKKSDLTLAQFIQKNGFRRMDIEQRLEKLGKDY